MNGYLLITNETDLDDVASFDWTMEVIAEWAKQRAAYGSVDVIDSRTGAIVYSA